ncbi:MAG: hypothetical protein LBO06_04380, partial [Bacteroidales bacterium]|nr:hypothetical protein [Bacteroidales bacterium]
DKQGNTTEYNEYNGDGKLTNKWTATYNKQGCRTKTVQYDENGKYAYHLEAKFDGNNNYIEAVAYDENGEVAYRWDYQITYDLKGNKSKEIEYRSEAKVPYSITIINIEYYQ